LEQVLWIATTDAGDYIMTEAPPALAMRYHDPRRYLSERRDTPLDDG